MCERSVLLPPSSVMGSTGSGGSTSLEFPPKLFPQMGSGRSRFSPTGPD